MDLNYEFNKLTCGLDMQLRLALWQVVRIVLLLAITALVHHMMGDALGISYWETAFWVIVFMLAIDRLRLMWEDAKTKNRVIRSMDAFFAKF